MKTKDIITLAAGVLTLCLTGISCTRELPVKDYSQEFRINTQALDASEEVWMEVTLTRGAQRGIYDLEWTLDGETAKTKDTLVLGIPRRYSLGQLQEGGHALEGTICSADGRLLKEFKETFNVAPWPLEDITVSMDASDGEEPGTLTDGFPMLVGKVYRMGFSFIPEQARCEVLRVSCADASKLRTMQETDGTWTVKAVNPGTTQLSAEVKVGRDSVRSFTWRVDLYSHVRARMGNDEKKESLYLKVDEIPWGPVRMFLEVESSVVGSSIGVEWRENPCPKWTGDMLLDSPQRYELGSYHSQKYEMEYYWREEEEVMGSDGREHWVEYGYDVKGVEAHVTVRLSHPYVVLDLEEDGDGFFSIITFEQKQG